MQTPAHYQTVIDVLSDMQERQAPADKVLAYTFRTRRYIGSSDKKAITQIFYGLLRQQLALQFLLKHGDMEASPRALVLTYLVKNGLGWNEIFTGEKFQPEGLTEDEKAFAQKLKEGMDEINLPPWAQYNVPPWVMTKLPKVELPLMNMEAPTDIRVNPLKTTRDDLMGDLKADFPEHTIGYSPHVENGLRVTPRAPLTSHPFFREGLFEVQDAGSQALVDIVANAAPMPEKPFIIDFCAGAGGKTLGLGALLNNKGRIWACDIYPKKLEEAKRRAKRAGLHNIHTHVLLETGDKALKRQNGRADIVFIDAPCSGSGTWRRNPDAKNRFQLEDLAEIVSLQKRILERAKYLVKPGGILVYATCSLFEEENTAQQADFSGKNADFTPMSITNPATGETGAHVQLSPSISDTDGFFACVWKRAEKD